MEPDIRASRVECFIEELRRRGGRWRGPAQRFCYDFSPLHPCLPTGPSGWGVALAGRFGEALAAAGVKIERLPRREYFSGVGYGFVLADGGGGEA